MFRQKLMDQIFQKIFQRQLGVFLSWFFLGLYNCKYQGMLKQDCQHKKDEYSDNVCICPAVV